MSHAMNTYQRCLAAFSHRVGSWLFELVGRNRDELSTVVYSGSGPFNVISSRAVKELHTSNLCHLLFQDALSNRSVFLSATGEVLLGHSGFESYAASMKRDRRYGLALCAKSPTLFVLVRLVALGRP